MPEPVPSHPAATAPVAGAVTNQLQASGDSSGCAFGDHLEHTQVFNGIYQRVYVYDNNPSVGTGGVVSGCPAVSYSYLDLNYTVQVQETKTRASYCSGLYQPQQLKVFSDSTTGGLGQSGTITTSAVGYLRRNWVTGTDTEDKCSTTSNMVIGKLPGEYNPTYDSSATIGSHIADFLLTCKDNCSRFETNLVDY